MIYVENKYRNQHIKSLEKITWKQSIIIGLAQAIALIPGTSRSGICTIAGVFLGIDKYTALQYSLLAGLPVMLGGVILDMADSQISLQSLDSLLVFTITFLVGYLCLRIINKKSKEKWLTVFGIYRIVLGIAILLFTI
jgi:undecaprenyl-diphosphatase